MAPSFFGVSTVPADNSTNTASPSTITPPASMQLGDLVVVTAFARASSGTITMSTTGGQTWTSLTQYNGTTIRQRIFWCTFNGTWSANPQVTFGSTTNNQAQMLVFRPDGSNYTWAVNNALANTAVSAPSTPFTFTRTGVTTTQPNAVAIAVFHCIAANTWGSLSGTGWINTSLAAQYRCTSGSGQSSSYAYQVKETTGATNNVSMNESAGTAGSTHILSFYEIAGPITSSQAGNWSSSATWGGHAAPASGDPVAINHAVDVDVDSVCGTGGATGTDELTINTGGTLTIKAGKKLTVQRDANLNGGAIVQEAGSTWEFSGTYRLRWTGTTGNTITINGTSGSRCTFQAAGSNTFYMAPNGEAAVWHDFNYCDITRMGSASQVGFDLGGGSTNQSIYWKYCKITNPGRLDFSNTTAATAATVFKMENCDYRGSVNAYLWVIGSGSGGTANANTRWFKNCTFVGASSGASILLREQGIANPWLIQGCVFEDVHPLIECKCVFDSHALRQPNYNSDREVAVGSSDAVEVSNCLAYVDNGTHVFEDNVTQAGSINWHDNISFCEGSGNGYENHYVITTNNANRDVTRCICVGDNAVVARYNTYLSTLNMDRLTHICKGSKIDSTFLIESEEVGATSTVNLRSCISYSVDNDILLAYNNVASPTANQIDFTDNNLVWDRALAGRYSGITITGKAVGDAGFGGSDLRADPQFNNVNATIQTWSTSLGGAGTVADAYAELLKMNGFDRTGTAASYNSNYTITAALAYFRAAFQPTNSALHGTGYGGVDIGAIDVASSGSTATIASAQRKQTSAITASEIFTGTVAGAQRKQISNITAAEIFTAAIASGQRKQVSAITATTFIPSAAIATAQRKQASAITALEVFSGTVATAQRKQSSAITATETFTSAGSCAQRKQVSSITASEIFSGTVAGAQRKQTSSITAQERFAATGATAQRKQTSAIVAAETFTSAGAGAQHKQTSSITASEIFTATIATGQRKQVTAITASTVVNGAVINTAQRKQVSHITATQVFSGAAETAQRKQISNIIATETFTATATCAQRKQATNITAAQIFDGSVSTTQRKQSTLISASQSFICTVATAQRKQTSAILLSEIFVSSLSTAQRKQRSAITAYNPPIPGSGSLLMFTNANNLGGINV